MDEIKYERKIIHRVVVFMRIMMGTVAISKLNEIILVMYYFVCIWATADHNDCRTLHQLITIKKTATQRRMK